jgi:hypothetical protein
MGIVLVTRLQTLATPIFVTPDLLNDASFPRPSSLPKELVLCSSGPLRLGGVADLTNRGGVCKAAGLH